MYIGGAKILLDFDLMNFWNSQIHQYFSLTDNSCDMVYRNNDNIINFLFNIMIQYWLLGLSILMCTQFRTKFA